MELSDVWSERIASILNSTVSQSIGCAQGELFDWQALNLVCEQHNIDFERDGLPILLAASAQLATVITMYAEDFGQDPALMHAQFVEGIENSGPSSA